MHVLLPAGPCCYRRVECITWIESQPAKHLNTCRQHQAGTTITHTRRTTIRAMRHPSRYRMPARLVTGIRYLLEWAGQSNGDRGEEGPCAVVSSTSTDHQEGWGGILLPKIYLSEIQVDTLDGVYNGPDSPLVGGWCLDGVCSSLFCGEKCVACSSMIKRIILQISSSASVQVDTRGRYTCARIRLAEPATPTVDPLGSCLYISSHRDILLLSYHLQVNASKQVCLGAHLQNTTAVTHTCRAVHQAAGNTLKTSQYSFCAHAQVQLRQKRPLYGHFDTGHKPLLCESGQQ